ncbi:MAG: RNA-binding protein [Gammaproteobacteria bacterium]|nr:RNA-binding protein [Gammaproteobacteria bacterium]
MKKLFVGNLPADTKEADLIELFERFGKVRSHKIIMDMFTRKCKGFGFIEMEGHEARAAIDGLNGKDFNGNTIKVNFETTTPKGGRRR